MLLSYAVTTSAEAPFRKLLISRQDNTRVEHWSRDHRDQPLPLDAEWAVRKSVLHGGKQEGVDLIEIDNGRLRLVIVPTRGMSVYEAVLNDVRLGWDSPVKELVHPRHINLQSRGGLGWLEGFNEWMVRCGLESAGHPGEDRFINNIGDEASMNLTLHGKIGNIPASEVEVIVENQPPYRIRVRGRVDERMFYGPQLELWTEVATSINSDSFSLHDSLTNRGGSEQEFQLIYHANFGPPLLGPGARLVAPIRKISPFNEHAAAHLAQQSSYGPPTAGFVEQVYCLRPWADDQGQTSVMLQNPRGDRGVQMSWSLDELPYLTQWKNSADLKSGYVTGIEPGTGFPYNRRVERHYGRVPKLQPGQSRQFTLDFTVLDTAEAVKRGRRKIEAIARGRATVSQAAPEVDLELFR